MLFFPQGSTDNVLLTVDRFCEVVKTRKRVPCDDHILETLIQLVYMPFLVFNDCFTILFQCCLLYFIKFIFCLIYLQSSLNCTFHAKHFCF